MTLKTDGSVLIITDNIKSVDDFQKIKKELDAMKSTYTSISIKIINSLSMTSSVIGYFMKLIHKDGISLSMSIGDERLINLLDELGLSSEFNVRKG